MDAAPGAGRLFARGLATSAGRDAGGELESGARPCLLAKLLNVI